MTERTADIAELRAAHDRVLARIAEACARVGRSPESVTLVAVTKTVEPARIRDAYRAGMRTFGENRVQEALAKQPEIPFDDVVWHLVGPLQSNKARRALEGFDVIESVDSVVLASRLDRIVGELWSGRRYPVLAQVNVDLDQAKAGFRPDDVETAMAELLAFPHLEFGGLMTVGRLTSSPDEARVTFRALRALSERLRAHWPDLGPALSMGMTDDFEVAIEEGATIVRVGRALFGERPDHDHDGGTDHRL
jgi:hypothetical protein